METSFKGKQSFFVNLFMIIILALALLSPSNGIVKADEAPAKIPVITEGEAVQISMDKNGAPTAFDLTLSIENAEEGDAFTWSISTSAAHGAASVATNGKASAVTYLPEADYVGEDEFTVSVVNQFGKTDQVLVKVSLLDIQVTPTAEPETTPTAEPTLETPAEHSNPNFAGYISLDFVAEQLLAYGWAASTPVTLSIDNPSTGTGEDYTETVSMSSASTPVATFSWPNIDIETDASLTVSGDGDSVQLVNSLVVEDINVYIDQIGGRGTVGANLTISILVGERYDRKLTIDENGYWIADFSVYRDIEYGSIVNFTTCPSGWVQSVEANGNLIKIEVPAFPSYIYINFSNPTNTIGSFHWPENASLTLTIDDPTNGIGSDYTETIINDNNTRGYFLGLVDFSLAEGQIIKVSDGTSSLSMVVPSFYVRLMDADTDLVCGTADSGSEVRSLFTLGTFPNNYWDIRYAITDQQGEWCFDYSSPTDEIDIKDNTHLYISQYDDIGNITLLSVLSTTFTDVPYIYREELDGTYYYLNRYVEALYDAGLTVGTSSNPPKFSPKLNLDRSMAAVFMLRGHFGTAYNPPSAPWNTFTNESWANNAYAQKWAEGMYQVHLTAGCQTSPLKYCPDRVLTREEAVVFALHLKYDVFDGSGNLVSSYSPPAASGSVFGDLTDTNYWATKWAEKAYLDGLLPACGTVNGKPAFCANDPVNRAWAAYMIVKAKNLTLP